jgi:hypothetical protein
MTGDAPIWARPPIAISDSPYFKSGMMMDTGFVITSKYIIYRFIVSFQTKLRINHKPLKIM